MRDRLSWTHGVTETTWLDDVLEIPPQLFRLCCLHKAPPNKLPAVLWHINSKLFLFPPIVKDLCGRIKTYRGFSNFGLWHMPNEGYQLFKYKYCYLKYMWIPLFSLLACKIKLISNFWKFLFQIREYDFAFGIIDFCLISSIKNLNINIFQINFIYTLVFN